MKIINSIINTIKQDILGNDNKYLAITWLLCVIGILVTGIYINSSNLSFLGLAEAREIQINFEYPVEIKKIHVIPGQNVEKNELLLELNQTQLDSEIRSLNSQLQLKKSELNVRNNISSLVGNTKNVDQSDDPLMVELNDLQSELTRLEAQKNNLYIFSEASGVVGSINFKKGEKVPAFSPVLTISTQSPTFVQGFIHERLHTQLSIGQVVTVSSIANSQLQYEGTIASLGSRITQIPLQLNRTPQTPVWGKEVIVNLPDGNQLLLSEKVEITPKKSWLNLNTAIAAQENKSPQNYLRNELIKEIAIPRITSQKTSFEPSGLVYLDDIKKYLVISDDTDEKKNPYLFLLDEDGTLEDQTLLVQDLHKIDDLESISFNNSEIYLLTSLSLNKKSKYKQERNLLVKLKKDKLSFNNIAQIELTPLLLEAIKNNGNKELALMHDNLKENMDVESHFILDENLYIGLKEPKTDKDEAIVLKIKNFKTLFENSKLSAEQVSLAYKLNFNEPSKNHLLSDLNIINNQLYALTTCKNKSCGALWLVNSTNRTTQLLKSYTNLRPEGIAYNPNEKSIAIVFDNGGKHNSFSKIPMHRLEAK